MNDRLEDMPKRDTFIRVALPEVVSRTFRVIPMTVGDTCAAFFALSENAQSLPGFTLTGYSEDARRGIAACLRELANAIEKDPDYPKGPDSRQGHVIAEVVQFGKDGG